MSDRMRNWPVRLELDPTAFIAPGAVVVGEVCLGARSSVWFNAVLRGDTASITVGEETSIQDNSVVHVDEDQPARIGDRVTVGHGAVLHGCVIEDECLIGMGVTVLSGARVGKGSLVAAGSLVVEGQEIPSGSLVLGTPARVKGPVSDKHREAIRLGSQHYVALARSYIDRGFARPHPVANAVGGQTARERGPMSFLEWGQLLGVLAEGPDWAADRLERIGVEQWRRSPAAGSWSALEVLCHLRDTDHEVFVPRLERLLREERPEFINMDMTGWETARDYNAQSPEEVISHWGADRQRALQRLAPLRPVEWARGAIHSTRGPYSLAEMVRYWADHDLSHRRQIAAALGEFR